MGRTVVEKIAREHMTEGPERPLRPGDVVSLRPRHVLTHDNTAAVMRKFRTIGAERIHDPRQPVFALDHDVQNTSPENLAKYREIEDFAREQGVDFHPAGTGIGHQIMVSMGYVVPGALVVASDSHANMYGALGALGTPVVRTDAAGIWAAGEFWWQIPRTVRVILEGELPPHATGKDVILTLCALHHGGEVLNAAVEFHGPGVASLSMDARMTVANMTTEWGALVGWFPVDEVTLAYLEERRRVLEARGIHRIRREDLEGWRHAPPRPDPDASYAGEIVLDLSRVAPMVTGPDTVQAGRPLAEVAAERIPVRKAYLLSCVNARTEDLEAAAAVLRHRRVAEGVELYVAAASREVQEAAEASGTWQILLDAGARPLPPGCGACIGLGTGLLEPGEVGISATNRNFKGRMGSRDARAYLASPAVVAASAAEGFITGPAAVGGTLPDRVWRELPRVETAEEERVEILPGFPERHRGRLVLVPRDDLNTDGIYGKEYTYREGMTPEEMARVVMANYDPTFASIVEPGDVLVGGSNFGTGSSREQAVTALQARGIALVVAGSFSQTYLRNAYNNGFVCIECPELVAALRAAFRGRIGKGEATIVPGDEVEVDFRRSRITWRGREFPFPPLGSVPQGLVVAGGLENRVKQRLAGS